MSMYISLHRHPVCVCVTMITVLCCFLNNTIMMSSISLFITILPYVLHHVFKHIITILTLFFLLCPYTPRTSMKYHDLWLKSPHSHRRPPHPAGTPSEAPRPRSPRRRRCRRRPWPWSAPRQHGCGSPPGAVAQGQDCKMVVLHR